MREAYIVDGVRTPIGDFGGSLKDFRAGELGAIVVRALIERNGIDPSTIDEVIMGCVFQAGQKANPARQASIWAGVPVEVPAITLNNQCASGLRSVIMAVQMIKLGEADVVVAGGCESMSTVPYLLINARWGYRLGHGEVEDGLLYDGLICVFYGQHMGVTAENLAEIHKISREEQDKFAYESHVKAVKAIKEGKFKEEIIPVEVKTRKGSFIFEVDEHPREDTTLENLSKLKPVFKKDGTVTAGNSSSINDGAACLLVVSEEAIKRYNLNPIAKVVSYATCGVPPQIMGWGPVPATKKALERAGLKLDDIGLVELNEAFAAQALACIKGLGLDVSIVNVNGSGISLGHPVGATGARILVTLLYEMRRRNVKYGLATLCQGGGMGTAVIVELV
ncbi:MAG: thiolase family protein [Thermosulfidibacteraceae bacterium]|jgi:acetyl-CoA C-acetyltransferase